MILFFNHIWDHLCRGKSYFLRFIFFLGSFLLVNYSYPLVTKSLYGIEVHHQDPYLLYFFPVLLLIFAIARKVDFTRAEYPRQGKNMTFLFLFLTIFVFLFPTLKGYINLSANQFDAVKLSQYYFQIVAGNSFLFLTIFGVNFFRRYSKELLLILLAVVLYMGAQLLISVYWSFFSNLIVLSLSKILPLFSSDSFVNFQNFSVRVKDFSVYIGPPCAGIFSLLTFVFFFVVCSVFMQGGRRINWPRFFVAFLVGLIAVVLLNLIRITVILMVGAYVSRVLALDLFHEYLGALFLILIFLIYIHHVIPKLYCGSSLKIAKT